ncbi:MAG: hypothetical protein AAGA27_02150 [Pseudomonadota bacterium]
MKTKNLIFSVLFFSFFTAAYANGSYGSPNEPVYIWGCPSVNDISFSNDLWQAEFQTEKFSPRQFSFIMPDFQGLNRKDKPIKFEQMSVYTLQSPANDFTCSYKTILNQTLTFRVTPDALLVGGNQGNKEVVCGLNSKPSFNNPHTETSTNKNSVVICQLKN